MTSPSMTAAEFKELVVAKKVKTIDALLPLLPEVMKKHAVMAYDSHALNTHLVTPLAPRVIFFNEDVSLILAFTQHPGEQAIRAGQDRLEVISFNNRTSKYEMLDVEFNGSDVPFTSKQPELNPSVCLKCHGSNPRPIFQDYNAWPGFYGSFSQTNVAAKGSIEYTNLKKFLDIKDSLPRYKDVDVSQFKETEIGISMASPLYVFGPATAFGMGLQKNMEIRLARKVLGHPLLPKAKTFIAYLGSDLATCAPIRQRVVEIYDAVFNTPARKAKAEKILADIRRRVLSDYEFKKAEFAKFNFAHSKADPRGVIGIFSNTLLNQNSDPYYKHSRESLEKQLVLFSVFADNFGLTSEDISTFPLAPTLGLVHILRLGLYSDEQMFLALSQVMISMNPFSLPRIENACAFPESGLKLKQKAMSEGAAFELGENSSVFEPLTK